MRTITTASLLRFIGWCEREIEKKSGVAGCEQQVRELHIAKAHARESIAFVKQVTTPDPAMDV